MILLIFLMLPGSLFSSEKIEEMYFKANQLYKKGQYEDALESYLKILDLGYESGHLYYNMGNTCFRLDSIGHAILYYERARALLPRDADLDYNLRYVRNLTKDVIEREPGFLQAAFFWLDSLTVNETLWIFVVMNVIFWSLMIARIYIKDEWAFYTLIIVLVLWIVAGASAFKKYYDVEADRRAVIVAEEVDVLSGPVTGDTVLFRLHEGSIVQFEREESGWYLISLPDEKRGWVERGGVERINEGG